MSVFTYCCVWYNWLHSPWLGHLRRKCLCLLSYWAVDSLIQYKSVARTQLLRKCFCRLILSDSGQMIRWKLIIAKTQENKQPVITTFLKKALPKNISFKRYFFMFDVLPSIKKTREYHSKGFNKHAGPVRGEKVNSVSNTRGKTPVVSLFWLDKMTQNRRMLITQNNNGPALVEVTMPIYPKCSVLQHASQHLIQMWRCV